MPQATSSTAPSSTAPSSTAPTSTSTSPAPDRAGAPVSFEHALDELESLVQHMEDGTLSLEQSLDAYRRGAQLVKVCETALERAREQVRVLDGELLRPLSEMATRGAERG